ncbi:uncharacterized protein LOC128953354 [Oppia nitens]|uniref:uncharacterized protein LOC128953354 n=1 Tax=Oppia nitens TaxID=1686743 RepID=UPI0023DA89AA|nr:uncharacterized protein LOC128953354 [Oppia nitens]
MQNLTRSLIVLLVLYYGTVSSISLDDSSNSGADAGSNWAVVVSGADTWFNYDMQASTYHVYQFLLSNGIPEDHIIVMHTDDIAYYSRNPTPGVVINEPNGTDVYHGVPKHYTGKDVTPQTFLKVLKGDEELAKQGRRVLKSGPNDNVFIYFNDHGSDDLICFPNGYLYSNQLNDALKYLFDNKRYAKLAFYLEACESGSMFAKLLPNNTNVYAITSSSPTELSWRMYCDSVLGSCLNDHFTYHWLLHSQSHDMRTTTLDDQFKYMAAHWNTTSRKGSYHVQHAQQYGDPSVAKLPLSQFMGYSKKSNIQVLNDNNKVNGGAVVSSREVPMYLLNRQIQQTIDINEKHRLIKQLNQQLNGRQLVDKHIEQYVRNLLQTLKPTLTNDKLIGLLNVRQQELSSDNRQCYHQFVDTFHVKCFNLNKNPYVLGKLFVFVNLCNELMDTSMTTTTTAVKQLSQYCDTNALNEIDIKQTKMFKLTILVAITYLCCSIASTVPVDNTNDPEFNGANWVVLVSGADGWSNYDMQAGIYHLYHFFLNNGIPADHIIVMHTDDIANAARNPHPGVVINYPNGTDYYGGVPKHYTGKEVNPKNFLKVLKGDEELAAEGKPVLKSGPNDHVFIHFNDHGSDDLICFPNEYMYSKDLIAALKSMHENKQYGKLVFYLESCDSGSMFDKVLPQDINVYAITSSKPGQLSWRMFCDSEISTCLNDHFTYHWMWHSDDHDLTKVTLDEQYQFIANHTNTSSYIKTPYHNLQQSQHYGDLSIAKLPASQFMGKNKKSGQSSPVKFNYEKHQNSGATVPSREVELYLLNRKINTTVDVVERQIYIDELDKQLKGRQLVDKHIEQYVRNLFNNLLSTYLTNDEMKQLLNVRQELSSDNRQCYHQFVDTFHAKCFNLNKNPYVLGKLFVFVNLCNELMDTSMTTTTTAVKQLSQYCDTNALNEIDINIQ